MQALIILALVAVAAADVSHILGGHHHDHHEHQYHHEHHDHADHYAAVKSFEPHGKPIAIVRFLAENSGLGDYKYAYETENGIQVQEEGVQKNAGSKDEAKSAQGSYSYTGPDGQVYSVSWIADEFGYRASGAHLPVAPEIPEEIKRSLELIASQPQSEQ